MMVLLLLYPVVFLFGLWVQTPVLMGKAGLPFWLALFIGNVVSVLLLNWLVPWVSSALRLVARAGARCGQMDQPRRRSADLVALRRMALAVLEALVMKTRLETSGACGSGRSTPLPKTQVCLSRLTYPPGDRRYDAPELT